MHVWCRVVLYFPFIEISFDNSLLGVDFFHIFNALAFLVGSMINEIKIIVAGD